MGAVYYLQQFSDIEQLWRCQGTRSRFCGAALFLRMFPIPICPFNSIAFNMLPM